MNGHMGSDREKAGAFRFFLCFSGAAAFLLCICLFFPLRAQAGPDWRIPDAVSQGRVFRVVLAGYSSEFAATLSWRGKTVPMRVRPGEGEHSHTWVADALLAMPPDAEGSYELVVRQGFGESPSFSLEETGRRYLIKAVPVPWKEQKLTVEPKYVEPPAEVRTRIARESEISKKIIASLSPEASWELPFARPVGGSVSSAFGGRRVFNGQPRVPHRGTDLRGPEGTPVHAVAAGAVALAEEHYFSGNVVYIDHGQGVISIYAHLSSFDVKAGDRVEQGQRIGRVGSTGRVTGPHLHLGVMVQGVAVDAMPLFETPLAGVGGPTPETGVTPQK